jgi:benzodiazapine receptor
MKTIYKLYILSIIICLVLGFLSGFAVKISDFSWYIALNKPIFNPPRWIFAPVWTLLYIMIGLSAVPIFKSGRLYVKCLFTMQFICNLLWTPLFFYLQRVDLALFNIIILLILLIMLLYATYNQKYVFYLLMPYCLWVAFAVFLNYQIYLMNA